MHVRTSEFRGILPSSGNLVGMELGIAEIPRENNSYLFFTAERDTYGVESVESDASVRQSRENYPAGTRTTGQQDNTHIIDAIKRQLARGRARAAIEDERIQRTRRKVDSMWQSLE